MGVQSVVTVLKDGPLPRVGVPIDLASSDDPEALFREARRRRRIIRAMVGRWGRPRPSRRRRSYRRCAHWPQTGRAHTAWRSQGPTATGGGDHRNLHRITALRRRRPRRRCRVIGRRIWTRRYRRVELRLRGYLRASQFLTKMERRFI